MFAPDAAERVRRRAGLGMTERVSPRALDRCPDLVAALHFDRSARPQVVEERTLHHHEVRDADDALGHHRIHRAELLGDPLPHLRRRIEPAGGRRDGEDPLGGGARLRRKRRNPLLELGDGRPRLGGLHAARRAFAAAPYIST